MAQEQSPAPAKTPWTKIFTAFRIALDLKKLVLAALGIFFVWLGWWALGGLFYHTRGFPEWKDYEDTKKPEERKAQWDYFKAKRASWNLIHELAGPGDDRKPMDAGDVATSPEEYEELHKWVTGWWRYNELVVYKDKTIKLQPESRAPIEVKITLADADAKLPERFILGKIRIVDAEKKRIDIDGVSATVDEKFKELRDYREAALDEEQVNDMARLMKDRAVANRAIATFHAWLAVPLIKKSGLLRMDPWHEYRGGNPYLLVADTIKSNGQTGPLSQSLNWLYSDELPVVLEPLYKLLAPVVYMFDARARALDRLYLFMIILWALAVWGFFGGAISRIAAVQFARNERIPLKEAFYFAKERIGSYFAAPVGPLVLIAVFAFLLMIFGWIEWIPVVGDVFAGVLWPIVLVLGFIMAIVLVGLIGWPLMIATISTEGTDSFDALSRSYSYVYQAPWRYLWYSFLAAVYGAALVFFIGFMASLMVFLGKWSVSSAAGLASSDPKSDRDPSYLFYYAPTSFGWRDLLISSNTRFVEKKAEINYAGVPVTRYEFTPEYEREIGKFNSFGAFLVACWIYPLFLLVVGFGYSFFWTASTIIYFLMRHSVDDTEVEEVYLEDEELEDPFLKQAPVVPPVTAPPSKPGTVSLNVVEAPPAATSYTADVSAGQPPPTPPSAVPPPSEPPAPPPPISDVPPNPPLPPDSAPPAP
ncbi:MAG TPA: hypothetical protein VFE62_27610 [Gemmataceae bacterium]|nr:hypothetical protein [Gemmataceae bacterium]